MSDRKRLLDRINKDPQLAEEVLLSDPRTNHLLPSFLKQQEGQAGEKNRPASKEKVDQLLKTLESLTKDRI